MNHYCKDLFVFIYLTGQGNFGDKHIVHQVKVQKKKSSVLVITSIILVKLFVLVNKQWNYLFYVFYILLADKELQEASEQHPVNYSAPVVVLSCFNGIAESLASE